MKNKLILLFCLALSFNAFSQISDVITNVSGPSTLLRYGDDLIFTQYNAGIISKIDLTASAPIVQYIMTGLSTAYGLALDGDILYLSEAGTGSIYKVDLSEPVFSPTLFLSGLIDPTVLLMNGNDLYICEATANRIVKVDITNTNPTSTVVVDGVQYPNGLALYGDDLYISSWLGNSIFKKDITLSSTTFDQVVSGLITPNHMKLDGDLLYFSQFEGLEISRIDLSETNPTSFTVLDNIANPSGLEFDGNDLLFGIFSENKIVRFTIPEYVTSCIEYVSPSGNYIWSTTGVYADTLSDVTGMDSLIFVDLTVLEVDISVTEGDTILTSNANNADYQWLDCNDNFAAINGATDQSFAPSANGNYALQVMQNGCTDTTDCYNLIIVNVEEQYLNDLFKVYPNPNSGLVKVDLGKTYDEISVTIINSLGQVLERKSIGTASQFQVSLDGTEGLYFLDVRIGKEPAALLRVVKGSRE